MCECAYPAVYETRLVKPRRTRRCCECDQMIDDVCQKASGLWDGTWGHWYTCLVCVATWNEVRKRLDVDCCYGHGDLGEVVSEYELIDHHIEEGDEEPLPPLGDHCVIQCAVPWLRRGIGGRYEVVEEQLQEVA